MNWTKEKVLSFLCNHAPEAPIEECMDLATAHNKAIESELYLKEMLAILSTLVLTINGKPLATFIGLRPAIQKALKEAQQMNTWVISSPGKNAMGRLMEKHEQ